MPAAIYGLVSLPIYPLSFVYHQYSVTTILQVVTPISFFEKSYILFLIAVSLCTCRRSNEEYYFYSTFERNTTIVTLISQMTQIFDLFGLRDSSCTFSIDLSLETAKVYFRFIISNLIYRKTGLIDNHNIMNKLIAFFNIPYSLYLKQFAKYPKRLYTLFHSHHNILPHPESYC